MFRASSMMQPIKYTKKNMSKDFSLLIVEAAKAECDGALQLVHNLVIILHKRDYLNLGPLMKPVSNGTIN
jgi:hypothetical protein